MFILASLLPIALAIIGYVFNKIHKIIIPIAYLGMFLFIIFSETPQSIVLGGWALETGIQFEYNFDVKLILLFFLIFSSFIYFSFFRNKNHEFTLLWLVLNGTLNSFFMSRDFFNIYVHIELISIIVFLLLAMDRNSKRIWASLKYSIMSSFALNFYLIGVGIFYSYSGTLNLNLSVESTFPVFSQSFIITGLLIKSGIFFLSGWLPDAQTEASLGVSAMLSGIVEKMGLWVIYLIFPILTQDIKDVLLYYGIISAILASIFTILQTDIKKFLAFSTMTQMSYGLIIIARIPEFFVVFLIYHMFSKGILFLLADSLYNEHGTKDIKKLKNIKFNLLTSIIFIILLFNMSGLFPSNLYFLKNYMIVPFIIEINVFLFGIYFSKIIGVLGLSRIIKRTNLHYLFLLPILFYISYYVFNFNLSKAIIQYILFILGIITYRKIKKYIKEKPPNLYTFDKSLIYQIIFLLLFFLVEFVNIN